MHVQGNATDRLQRIQAQVRLVEVDRASLRRRDCLHLGVVSTDVRQPVDDFGDRLKTHGVLPSSCFSVIRLLHYRGSLTALSLEEAMQPPGPSRTGLLGEN